MNINNNYNNSINSLTVSNRNKMTSLRVNASKQEQSNVEKTEFTPQGNVVDETGSMNLYKPEEIFNTINRNATWIIDGEEVSFKDLDDESKSYLFEFSEIHKEYNKDNSNKRNFGDLITNLGNAYASKREELTGKYSGTELDEKLSKLENTFKMYTETKVVGNVNEVGSMANVAHFDLIEARTARLIKETQEALQSGKNINCIKKRDITSNDKQASAELLKNAKSALDNVTEFFNKNGVVKGNQIKELYNYTGENGTWSLGKLNMTFELLENTKISNPDRYSKTEFNEVMNSEDANKFFTDDEKSIFKEIYNCYN